MRATLSNFEKYDKATYFASYYVTYETYNIFAQKIPSRTRRGEEVSRWNGFNVGWVAATLFLPESVRDG